jgi:hypothetical protein
MVVPHQIGDPQLFMVDHLGLTDERQRRLVVEVLPLAAHTLMGLGQPAHRLAAPVAARDTPSDAALAFG